jgi:O-antigen ligase
MITSPKPPVDSAARTAAVGTSVGTPPDLGGVAARVEPVWSLAFLGLCVFTFAIVTYRFPVGELGIAIAMVGLAVQRPPLRAPAPFWILLAFIVWSSLSAFASPFPTPETHNLWERLKLLAIFFVVVNVLRTGRQIYVYLAFLLLCFLLFPARGALVNYAGGYTVFGRALWNYTYANPNDLAALTLIAIGIAAALVPALAKHRYVRWGTLAAAAVLLIVVLLTQSRGAFIGLLAGFGIGAWKTLRVRRAGLVIGAVIAVVLAALVPNSVWDRLSGISKLTSTDTIAAADQEGSAEQRWEIQQTAVRIVADNWLLGVGPGAYRAANAVYAPQIGPKDTHNTYLNVAAETGVPGLVLWVALVISVLVRATRAWRGRSASDTATGGIGYVWITRGLVAFLVAGIFGSYAAITMPYIILATLWCCAHLTTPGSRQMRRAVQ